MKIQEIIGSVFDQEYDAVAPDSSVMRRVANAFTRSGQVRHNWDVAPVTGMPSSALNQFPSAPLTPKQGILLAPREDAISDAGTTALAVSAPRPKHQVR